MINNDMLFSSAVLLGKLIAIHPELDALNQSVLKAMDSERPEEEIVMLFPDLMETSSKTSDAMEAAIQAIDWEVEGNTFDVFVKVLSGELDVPNDLGDLVRRHKEFMDISEKELVARYGENPLTKCMEILGVRDTFELLVTQRDSALEEAVRMSGIHAKS